MLCAVGHFRCSWYGSTLFESVVYKLVIQWLIMKADFMKLSFNILPAHVHFIGQLLQRVAAEPEFLINNAQENKWIELFGVFQFHDLTS